ncbi:hypothetical protein [Nonomuraea jiangxiensis]|uniref:Uncharacterized protein n=1 Tax=Nonomuraea jiangxiensis TaxID=633440 RepID=A0A1G9JQ71_9ACTN|nr:hypothetical protein [Nonomuraea jiangxiensis]SDL39153.1 hypothetical protein SAMN05421869_125104 [Nonomuraea jiangxiensis]
MDSALVTRIRHTTIFVIRLALLVPLLGGMLISTAASLPTSRTLAQFRTAALAGEIDRVNYRDSDSGVLEWLEWSEAPLVWHHVDAGFTDTEGPYTTARLMTDVRQASAPPSLVRESMAGSSGNDFLPDRPFDIPGGWWVAVSWGLAFLVMLCSTPRLANRWAWFWMFTVGQIGALLYLVLEPRPLWRGPGEGLNRGERVSGGRGCGYSILLAITSVIVAAGIGGLLEWALG